MPQYHENPIERTQLRMLMLEEEIAPDSDARFIDLYIEQLDLAALGFWHTSLVKTGRRPYKPSDLLKLYLYGYLHGVRSSRKLERECRINLEVQWLLHGNAPTYKTISDFRKENADAILGVFREFVSFCDGLGLIGKTIMAVDGTRIRANNSKAKYITHGKINKQMEYFEESIHEYIKAMDALDEQEGNSQDKESLQNKLEHAKKRLVELKAQKKNSRKQEESP